MLAYETVSGLVEKQQVVSGSIDRESSDASCSADAKLLGRMFMKHSLYLSTSLAAGAFLLAGSFTQAQTTSAARNMHPRDAASGQSSGRQAKTGSTPGMAVDHQGGNGVRRADTGKSGDNPLYEGKGQANLKPGAGSSAVQYKD